jgi:DNA-binding Xre family transcriptional regulator
MPKRLKLQLTEEQKRIAREMRAEAERERPELFAEAKRVWEANDALQVELRSVFSLLRAVRKAQNVSLNELAGRTGISKPALSRMENDPAPNVQLTTLQRIAAALGKELRISLSAAPVAVARPHRRSEARVR